MLCFFWSFWSDQELFEKLKFPLIYRLNRLDGNSIAHFEWKNSWARIKSNVRISIWFVTSRKERQLKKRGLWSFCGLFKYTNTGEFLCSWIQAFIICVRYFSIENMGREKTIIATNLVIPKQSYFENLTLVLCCCFVLSPTTGTWIAVIL